MPIHAAAWAALLARALFTLVCVTTAGYAFLFLYRSQSPDNPFAAQFALSGWDVPAHFFGAGLALLLVPLQASGCVRRRWPTLHRTAGWLSAAAILIGGLSGLSLAPKAQGGLPATTAFVLLSLLWLGITANGIRLAITGDLARHRVWMIFSMALTTAAITLRLILGAGIALQLPVVPVYVTAAWSSWLLNLAICAGWLAWQDRRHPSMRAGADTRSALPPRSA